MPDRPGSPTLSIPTFVSHMAGIILLQSTMWAIAMTLPVVAIKRFDAGPTEVVVLTAAPNVLFALSIFWNAIFERLSLHTFWVLFWCVACLPYAFGFLVESYTHLAVLTVLSSIGLSGFTLANGELLKRLYPDARRGVAFGVLSAVWMSIGAGMVWGLGRWLEHNPDAFQVFLPLGAGVQLIGALVLWGVATRSGAERERHRVERTKASLASLVEPIVHMKSVLKDDRVFARYEAAFVTYGAGWMICHALVQLIATRKLGLGYEAAAESTTSMYLLVVAICFLPSGWLVDRIGAVRTCALAFTGLALYPIGLWLARDKGELTLASLWYGFTHAPVSAAWMLGPVALAPSPKKVPQYVAIHSTLVGVRGLIFQALAVVLVRLTESYSWPLALASVSLVWAGWQMWALDKRMRGTPTNA